jgi:hypothetical protein
LMAERAITADQAPLFANWNEPQPAKP